jgi:hypothetical protein
MQVDPSLDYQVWSHHDFSKLSNRITAFSTHTLSSKVSSAQAPAESLAAWCFV